MLRAIKHPRFAHAILRSPSFFAKREVLEQLESNRIFPFSSLSSPFLISSFCSIAPSPLSIWISFSFSHFLAIVSSTQPSLVLTQIDHASAPSPLSAALLPMCSMISSSLAVPMVMSQKRRSSITVHFARAPEHGSPQYRSVLVSCFGVVQSVRSAIRVVCWINPFIFCDRQHMCTNLYWWPCWPENALDCIMLKTISNGACAHTSSFTPFATQSSHVVDRAGWQAKMASIEFWIPWHNAHSPLYWLKWVNLWATKKTTWNRCAFAWNEFIRSGSSELLLCSTSKGPSQKFAEAQWNEQNSFGRVGVFGKIALCASNGVLYTHWSESWSLKCELLFVSRGGRVFQVKLILFVSLGFCELLRWPLNWQNFVSD